MSLVAQVIASARTHGAPLPPNLQLDMERISSEANRAKDNVCKALKSRYVLLTATIDDNEALLQSLTKCQQTIKELYTEIENQVIPSVEGSASEIEKITNRLSEVKLELVAAESIFAIHSDLEEANAALHSEKYKDVAENLIKAEEHLSHASQDPIESELNIVEALQMQLALIRTEFFVQVEEKWKTYLSFSEDSCDTGDAFHLSIRGLSPSTETRMGDKGVTDPLSQVVVGLSVLGELEYFMRGFGRTLMDKFFRPIILDGCIIEIFSKGNDNHILSVRKPPSSSQGWGDSPLDALHSLNCLKKIFFFLHDHFGQLPLEDCSEDWFMKSLSSEIGEALVELILTHCLEASVPVEQRFLQNYDDVRSKVEELHKFLIQIGFYDSSHQSLMNYVSDIDAAFFKKSRQSLLMRSRDLLTKSLTATRLLSPETPEDVSDFLTVESDQYESVAHNEASHLFEKTFHFPSCRVSESIIELIDLITATLEQVSNHDPESAARHFSNVKKVFTMYSFVVPVAHSNCLETNPEIAALIHNNSLYLSHQIMLLGMRYKDTAGLPPSVTSSVEVAFCIRNCGCDILLKTLQKYKQDFLNNLRDGFESSSLKYEAPTLEPLERSLRTTLDRFGAIAKAWNPILPHSVYSSAIGILAQSVIEDLIHRITTAEEISAHDALELVGILRLLQDKVPPFFDTLNALSQKVTSWNKLEELIFVLESNLRDLDDRWADGKGPLAAHFTAPELKHLVKALFQNTDRRAQFLSRVK